MVDLNSADCIWIQGGASFWLPVENMKYPVYYLLVLIKMYGWYKFSWVHLNSGLWLILIASGKHEIYCLLLCRPSQPQPQGLGQTLKSHIVQALPTTTTAAAAVARSNTNINFPYYYYSTLLYPLSIYCKSTSRARLANPIRSCNLQHRPTAG